MKLKEKILCLLLIHVAQQNITIHIFKNPRHSFCIEQVKVKAVKLNKISFSL